MEGQKIQDAQRAMQIFLRSIPEGAYFNFYLFGSTYKSLFQNKSQLFTADTFSQAKAYAAVLSADLGGTEILPLFEKIFSEPPQTDFSRQIFLMTDGEVTNTQEVIDLVRKNAANSRLFAFGLGESPSRSLVNGIAAAGNGKAEFIKQGDGQLENAVGRQLSRALQPAVTGVVVKFNGVANVRQAPSQLPAIFKVCLCMIYLSVEKRNEFRFNPARSHLREWID